MILRTAMIAARVAEPVAVRRINSMDKKAKQPKKPKTAKPKGAKTA